MWRIKVKLDVITGSFNGFSPVQRQAIIWTSAALLLIVIKLRGNLSQNTRVFIHENEYRSIVFKMTTVLSQPRCLVVMSTFLSDTNYINASFVDKMFSVNNLLFQLLKQRSPFKVYFRVYDKNSPISPCMSRPPREQHLRIESIGHRSDVKVSDRCSSSSRFYFRKMQTT